MVVSSTSMKVGTTTAAGDEPGIDRGLSVQRPAKV